MCCARRRTSVDSKDRYDRTPLWCAVHCEHEALVLLLLDTGEVDIDSKDKFGGTPLLAAAYMGHETIVKMFVDLLSLHYLVIGARRQHSHHRRRQQDKSHKDKSHQGRRQCGARTLFTALRYLYNERFGRAICAKTEPTHSFYGLLNNVTVIITMWLRPTSTT